MATYRFTGEVFDKSTNLPAAAVQVEAMDAQKRVLQPVCVGLSNAAGEVVLTVSDDTLRKLFGGEKICLYFRMTKAGSIVGSTEESVRWDGRQTKRSRLLVDTTAPLGALSPSSYVVEGSVVDVAGDPLDGKLVRVYRRRLGERVEPPIAATTSVDGRYRAAYAFDPTSMGSGPAPELLIRVIELVEEEEQVVGEASICRAPVHATVDVVVGGEENQPNPGLTERATLTRQIAMLNYDGSMAELTGSQVTAIACQLELPEDEVTAYVSAAKLNDAREAISFDTFYAFMKKGIGASEDEIFAHRLPALRRMIQEAAASHVIAPSAAGDTELGLTMAALETAALEALRVTGGNKLRLGRVVDLATNAGITLAHRNNFLKLALNFEGTGEEFWAAVDAAPETGDPEDTTIISAVAKTHFKFMAEASALTGAHEGAVTALYASFDAGTLGPAPLSESARGIAALTEAEIVTLLDGEYPAELYDTVAEYAAAISTAAETRYRTARIRSRVAPESVVGEFFTAYPAFEFETSRVGPYLIEHAVELEAEEFDVQALKAELESLERRLKITNSYDEMVVLKEAVIESAFAANELGVDGLSQLEFDPNVAKNIAKATLIYQKSCWATGAATAMMARYNTKLLSSPFTGIIAKNLSKPANELPNAVADWETLFGSLDQCECKHCDSVLSPAAYLVDTLEMLKKVGPPGANARDELLDRRPDLAVLGLTCDNAYTPMPYIDVVNEIMEVCVADPLLFPESPEVVETIGTAEELAAHPDILYPALHVEAYNELNGQVHPFILPFNLWQEEARVYLDHLGVSREALIEAFARDGEDNEEALAVERLRVAKNQYKVIARSLLGSEEEKDYWNLTGGAWRSELSQVRVFLRQAGIDFEALRELLETNFCTQLGIALAGESCDLDDMTVTGFEADPEDGDAQRSTLHRLLRLSAALGFSLPDTDRARVTFGGALEEAAVRKIAALKRIVQEKQVAPRVAMTWFGDMDRHATSTDPSLFERVFLDRKATSPSYPAFLEAFNQADPEEQSESWLLGKVRPGLAAALSLTDRELMTMIDEETANREIGMAPLGPPYSLETGLSVRALSRLYAAATYARAIRRPLADTIVLSGLAGAVAVEGLGAGAATPAAMLAFDKTLRRFDRTNLSMRELQYIARNFAPVESGVSLSDEDFARADSALLAELEKAANGARDVNDPEGAIVAELGERLLGSQGLSGRVLDASWTAGRASYTTSSEHGLVVGDWIVVTGMSPTGYNVAGPVAAVTSDTVVELDLVSDPGTFVGDGDYAVSRGFALLQLLIDAESAPTGASLDFAAPFLGDSGAISMIVNGSSRLESAEARRTYVAQRFSRYVACRAVAIGWVAQTFGLETDVASALLGTTPNGTIGTLGTETAILKHTGRYLTGEIAVRALIPGLSVYWTAPMALDREERRQLSDRLHKVALIIKKLQLTAADLQILYPNGAVNTADLPSLDLHELEPYVAGPAEPISVDEQAIFSQLLRLGDYVWVRSRYPGREAGLTALFEEEELEDQYGALVKATGFSRPDVERLSTRLVEDLSEVHFKNDHLLLRIFESVELLGRLGASATVVLGPEEDANPLRGWRDVQAEAPVVGAPPDPEDSEDARALAQQIKATARAKHTDEAWATIGKEIRDPLRDKQRAALSHALVSKLNLNDTNELFEELLVDVEMSPCAMTSRIVCAHGSVQTFVNRIQLNLEDDFRPSKQLSREWDWMHAYRLWEANRKVFLWPENWIEPELRDTKTPLFEELETALLQGPLNDANVEDAYRAYLDGLADIGNLEIVATHTEPSRGFGAMGAVHVFGRTPAPHRYYHRTKTEQGWQPWRKMDVDIQSDHILPISVNGTLYVFWTQIEDVPNGLVLGEGAPTALGCKVSLGISQLRRGRWSTVVGRSVPVTLAVSVKRSNLCLTGSAVGDKITLRLLRPEGVINYAANGAWELAEFEFNPSTSKVSASALTPLHSSSYTSNTSDTLAFGTKIGVFGNGAYAFQGYLAPAPPIPSVLSGQLSAWRQHNGGVPTMTPLLKESGARVVVDRQLEPVKERRNLLLQTQEGAFHLDLRVFPPKPLTPEEQVLVDYGKEPAPQPTRKFVAELFYHPYVGEFRKRVTLKGLDGLIRPRDGVYTESPQFLSEPTSYLKAQGVPANFPDLEVQFMTGTAYGDYNWELFFHAPFLIANRLHQEGRFDEARKWYHVIFDPTCGWDPEEPETFFNRYAQFWKFKPFAQNLDLATIQEELTGESSNQYVQAVQSWSEGHPEGALSDSIKQQIAAWRADPFDPHTIARLRIVAYQKAVVQKYVENLIAWGDQLFAQSTMESVNEATQLYIHALQLLGRKPTIVSRPEPKEAQSYDGLPVDAFGNPLVAIETITPPYSGGECNGSKPGLSTVYGTAYFCVPENEKLFGLWDIIEDRLFKIRHCQSIDGVVRQLPLFQPPIDPALLVRAAAAGIDLDSVLNDLYVSAPPYRYAILAARAMEYASAVTGLGSAVLSALEKDDGEELAQLRAGHDVANQRLSRDVRKQQLEEAKESLESVKRSMRTATAREKYYASRELMSAGEEEAERLTLEASQLQRTADLLNIEASVCGLIPNFGTGGAGMASPRVVTEFGGIQLSTAASLAAEGFGAAARAASSDASAAANTAGYQRRMDDWKFQAAQAKLEIAQLEKQIIAAEIRVAIAENELKLVEQQIDQVKAVEDFLRSKFTNRELYGWMKGQLAAVYQQSYDLAFKMARNAERAFQVERGDTTQTFITFGGFDGFRKGLMAGEKLSLDIRRMDAAYHTQNKREHEIVKTISIAQLNPDAFMRLRAGSTAEAEDALYQAEFSMPETIFDDDFPNHHMRRIKDVNVTVQCTPGPYQSVSGKLSMFKSATRVKPQDSGFVQDARIAEIATSSASSDSGMFELNFRDERYLPFEYRGVSSGAPVGDNPYGPGQWRFELLGGNEMDFDSVTDLVMQLRYTAREGRAASNPAVGATKRSILRRVSSAHADLWSALKMGSSENIVIPLSDADFPKGVRRGFGPNPLKKVVAYARWSTAGEHSLEIIAPAPEAGTTTPSSSAVGSYLSTEVTAGTVGANPGYALPSPTSPSNWTFVPSEPTELQDLWIAFYYELSPLA